MLQNYRQWFLWTLATRRKKFLQLRDDSSHLCVGASRDTMGGLSTGNTSTQKDSALPHALLDGDLALKSGKINGPTSHSLDLFGGALGTDSLPFSHDSG